MTHIWTYTSGSFEEDTELPKGLENWNKETKEKDADKDPEKGAGGDNEKLPEAI